MENANPHVFEKTSQRTVTSNEESDAVDDEIDKREIFGETSRRFRDTFCKFQVKTVVAN